MGSKIMWRVSVLLTLFAIAGGHAVAQGRSSDSARAVAASCVSCHGTQGVSTGGIASLAGRPKEETIARMQEFKTGKRAGTVMPHMAAGYTDAQIERLAGWFAAQKPAP